jgi:disulfide oxidoreductase YuzD
LIDVVKDCTSIFDKISGKSFKARWAEGSDYYSDQDFEEVIWDVIHKMKHLHKHGFTERLNDDEQIKKILKTKEWTFAERYDSMKNLLKVSNVKFPSH